MECSSPLATLSGSWNPPFRQVSLRLQDSETGNREPVGVFPSMLALPLGNFRNAFPILDSSTHPSS